MIYIPFEGNMAADLSDGHFILIYWSSQVFIVSV